VCDGYGVWGGGGNAYGTAERTLNYIARQTLQPSRRLDLVPGLTQQEWDAFHYFRVRAAIKLPGVFGSDFWQKLVFQISLQEPAVLHAVIALAATHRRGIIPGHMRRPFPIPNKTGAAMDPNERLALQQYNKAINHLRPHLDARDEQSMRVTLASCVLFICIELLKGDIENSQAHFRSGLKLLRAVHSAPTPSSADEYLTEAFVRINLQPSLFTQGPEYAEMWMPGRTNRSEFQIPLIFDSMNEARRHLDWILHDTHLLSAETSSLLLPDGIEVPSHLIRRREALQASVSAWLRTTTASIPGIRARCRGRGDDVTLGEPLLLLYHRMASIMVATSLRRADETAFDRHTADFADILEKTIELWNRVLNALRSQISCGKLGGDLGFTADMGFIPPLYYTALKCRVPRYRRCAEHFLVSTPHREGMWDGTLAAVVARKIFELEEGDFYSTTDVSFAHGELLSVHRVPPDDVPLPPGERRINDVCVSVPEVGSAGELKAALTCRRYNAVTGWETGRVELVFRPDSPCYPGGTT